MTDAEYLEKFNTGALQAWVGEWYSWVNDPIYHLHWNFNSAATATNVAGYSNPKVDELINAAMYEPDKAKRDQMSLDIQKIVVDEAPWGLALPDQLRGRDPREYPGLPVQPGYDVQVLAGEQELERWAGARGLRGLDGLRRLSQSAVRHGHERADDTPSTTIVSAQDSGLRRPLGTTRKRQDTCARSISMI